MMNYRSFTLLLLISLLFSLSKLNAKVLSPKSGDIWYVGSIHYIIWEWEYAKDNEFISIELSIDNGNSWTTIVESTPCDGYYEWTIPSVVSNVCIIKLKEPGGSRYSESEKFTIIRPPTINIASPIGGENWVVGSVHNITWTSTSVTYVKIDYSTDGGSTWLNIIQSTPSNGSYSWTIPNTTSTNCFIKITNVTNSSVYKWSNSFTISSQPITTITITSPNGDENWQAGTSHDITWTGYNSGNVKIEYSDNYVGSKTQWKTVTTITSPKIFSYSWTVPNTPSTNCKLRINNGVTDDESDNVFTISAPPPQTKITVTLPNGGENWLVGSSHKITWECSWIEYVNIEYTTDNGGKWINIYQTTPSDGSCSWTIPNTPSKNCKVRISDASNSSVNDQSDNVFTISTQSNPAITVISPNGGENWQTGTSHDIIWISSDVDNVQIEYSTNDRTNWTNIVSSTSSDGSYSWTVPNTSSTNCKVRISDASNSSVNDQSNNVFTISTQPSPTITVTLPNGGENWQVVNLMIFPGQATM